jgi:undecaprenyl phosphate N,N'-diacetylbacillosamine 1-phosphate transferase
MIYARIFKPLLDRTLAFVLLLVAFLPMLLVGLSIAVTLGRPVLFKQVRPGRYGRLFTIYKFRTMSRECDASGTLLPDHLRLRGVGKFIRSTSLDELPQLVNILRGEMSFIGPRPLLVEYLPLYSPRQRRRHDVLPGITGWAQVNGRNTIGWEKKFELDLEYVEQIGFLTDLKILLMTLKKVFFREDIAQEGHVTMEKFNGKN